MSRESPFDDENKLIYLYNQIMLEIRPILEQIADLEEREVALRGYL